MTKRFKFILIISAVALFIIALLLDITEFASDWNNITKDIELTSILLVLTLIVAFGLFLGLFLFNRRPYKKRLFLTIPIAFLLFSIIVISKSIIRYYGLTEAYNYFTAKRDIQKGKIQILETGLILPPPNVDWDKLQAAEIITAKHFGYESVYLGCIVTSGIGIYNRVMEDYLSKRNGKNWRIKERQMIDSIMITNITQ